MIEAVVAAILGCAAGGYTVIASLHKRVSQVDQQLDARVDKIELVIARDYVTRDEFVASQNKLEEHMLRIENKLDQLIFKK